MNWWLIMSVTGIVLLVLVALWLLMAKRLEVELTPPMENSKPTDSASGDTRSAHAHAYPPNKKG